MRQAENTSFARGFNLVWCVRNSPGYSRPHPPLPALYPNRSVAELAAITESTAGASPLSFTENGFRVDGYLGEQTGMNEKRLPHPYASGKGISGPKVDLTEKVVLCIV